MDLKLSNYQRQAKSENKNTKHMTQLESTQKMNFETQKKRLEEKKALEGEIRDQKEKLALRLKK